MMPLYILTVPIVVRNQSGEIVIAPADAEQDVYYTVCAGATPASVLSQGYGQDRSQLRS